MLDSSSLPADAVAVRGLDKTYGGGRKRPGKEALKGVDLAIPRGSLFGLLHDLVFLLELGLAAEEGHGSIIESRRKYAGSNSGRSKLRSSLTSRLLQQQELHRSENDQYYSEELNSMNLGKRLCLP